METAPTTQDEPIAEFNAKDARALVNAMRKFTLTEKYRRKYGVASSIRKRRRASYKARRYRRQAVELVRSVMQSKPGQGNDE